MGITTTSNYDIANAQPNKEPVIVLEIEGVPYVFGSETIYTTIRYDDPGVFYDGTYVYDGLRPLAADKQKKLIDRKGSSSTISQKLEQWDGKASIETFNIKLVDYQQVLTLICSPGQMIEDIINRKVKITYGFKSISYPEDYITMFKGYINNVKIAQGAVFFTFTDPSFRRKQVLFNASTSKLTNAITNTDTTLTVSSTSNFYETILNAKGVADPGVSIGLVLDGKEIVTYVNSGIISQTQVSVVRGQFGTAAVAHDPDIEIKAFLYLNDNPFNIALKTMLSGWNGPCFEGLNLRGIVNTDDGFTELNTITFSQAVDVTRDYGVTLGDFITMSGSPNAQNNGTFTVSDILNNGRTVKFSDSDLLQEDPSGGGYLSAVVAIRSKYDVYPLEAGLSLTTDDVFVDQWESNRNLFVQINFQMEIVGQETNGKQWIETHLLKPLGAYSLTQGTRVSVGITHPPLANDLTKSIGPHNVVSAKDIVVERGVSTRFFYNEINFNFEYDSLSNTFYRSLRIIDADAQSRTRQVSVLDVDVRGLNDTQANRDYMTGRANRLLQRYKFAAETIDLQTFFSTGNTIDAGDIVILSDTETPVLQIANTETGSRGIPTRIMEVQERSVDVSQGRTKLKLLSNNGYSLTERYGIVAPGSDIDGTYPNTTTSFRIKDSGSVMFPGAEYKKWRAYVGSNIRVHNKSFADDAVAAFTIDPFDPYLILVSPALPFIPGDGYVMEFESYDDTSAAINQTVKATFVHLDSDATIFSASSSTVFVLDSGYSSRYRSGMIIYVMSPDGSRYSPDVKILSVVGDVVTIGATVTGGSNANLGFTPQPGDLVRLGGFLDDGPGYRLI